MNGKVYFGLKIPYLDSLLVGFGPGTRVTGWDTRARRRPPARVWLIHLSFDAMVGLAFLLLLAGLWALRRGGAAAALPQQRLFWWRRRASAGSRRSWRWSAAGSSPRSAGSRGSCTSS